jgi:metal-sulfur cluster biosynthetic enzyme
VGMGIIDSVAIDDGAVSVAVLPTFPDCLFRGVFEEEIERKLKALTWCRSVSVSYRPADESWDESRMTPEARGLLGRGRKATREAGR